MTKEEFTAFSEELEKYAFPAGALLRRGARWLTEHGAARGAATGAGLGAATGATGAAVRGGDATDIAAGGVLGGLGGAALGGAGGSLGRRVRDIRLLKPGMSAGGTAKATVGAAGKGVANFGKRQVHGFTGAYRNQAGAIGMPSNELAKQKAKVESLRMKDRLREATSSRRQGEIIRKSTGRTDEIRRAGKAGQEALEAGITSLPGIAKGLSTAGRETSKAIWRHNVGKGLGRKAMAVGPAAAFMGPELAKGDESDKGGKSMGQKLLNTAAFVTPAVALNKVPIVANLAGWTAADALSNAPYRKRQKKGKVA